MKKLVLTSIVCVSFILTSTLPAFAIDSSTTTSTSTGTSTSTAVTTTAPAATATTASDDASKITVKDYVESTLVKDIDQAVVTKLKGEGYTCMQIALFNELAKKSSKTIDEVVAIYKQEGTMLKTAAKLGVTEAEFNALQDKLNQAIKAVEKSFNDEVERQVVKNVDPKVVEALRSKGYGYGQIALIAGLAAKSGKSIDEVEKVLKEQKGMGKVAKALGIKLVNINKIKNDIAKAKVKAQNVQLEDIKKKADEAKIKAQEVKEKTKTASKKLFEKLKEKANKNKNK